MGGLSVWHWLIFLLWLACVVFGIWLTVRIIRRAGYSGWWVLILLVPVVNIVMIWVFAFSDWPALARARGDSAPRLDTPGRRRGAGDRARAARVSNRPRATAGLSKAAPSFRASARRRRYAVSRMRRTTSPGCCRASMARARRCA